MCSKSAVRSPLCFKIIPFQYVSDKQTTEATFLALSCKLHSDRDVVCQCSDVTLSSITISQSLLLCVASQLLTVLSKTLIILSIAPIQEVIQQTYRLGLVRHCIAKVHQLLSLQLFVSQLPHFQNVLSKKDDTVKTLSEQTECRKCLISMMSTNLLPPPSRHDPLRVR